MTPEEKDLLQKTYALTVENHEILMKIRHSAKMNSALRWVYWIIIIGLSAVSLFYLPSAIQGLTGGLGLPSSSNSTMTSLGL